MKVKHRLSSPWEILSESWTKSKPLEIRPFWNCSLVGKGRRRKVWFLCELSGMRKILVIDDDDQLIELVKLCLTITSGWKVLPASSGQEAAEVLKVERPDAILLDFHMPTMDGLETLKLIRRTPENRGIPVLAYTGDTQALDRDNLPEGITDVLIKPFNPDALAGRLEALWTEA